MVVQEGSLHYQLIKDKRERLREALYVSLFCKPNITLFLFCTVFFFFGGVVFITIITFDLYM